MTRRLDGHEESGFPAAAHHSQLLLEAPGFRRYNTTGVCAETAAEVRLRTRNKWLLGCLAAVILLVLAMPAYFRLMYPHGFHPACARALKLGLMFYAGDHGGKFPAGEATPEASLSLLYPQYADARTLAGKRKSGEIAERILMSGGRLGPETCDWHYVEGLTESDDGQIAIFWDKSNLDHAGRRMFDGSHEVFRIWSGSPEYISASRLAEFLAEQERLLAGRQPKVP